jgi:hypothetical protein
MKFCSTCLKVLLETFPLRLAFIRDTSSDLFAWLAVASWQNGSRSANSYLMIYFTTMVALIVWVEAPDIVSVTGTVYVPGLALGLVEPQPDSPVIATNPQQTTASINRRGSRRRVRGLKSANMEHGKSSASARRPLPRDPRWPVVGSSIAVVAVDAVLMVSVSVAVVVLDVMVTDGGAKEQVTCAGSVPQEKVTVPV